ncbi:hypothetical protein Hamer_G012680 [Homarus americanus]|uniref:Uncharacterized protein n=1 Tax=Homarus americanus TaxID=6706 RepID=A0A8J5JSD0_HOMAM|nr:hypothetical protein Hamer_G012680 [Homarus americanus]
MGLPSPTGELQGDCGCSFRLLRREPPPCSRRLRHRAQGIPPHPLSC